MIADNSSCTVAVGKQYKRRFLRELFQKISHIGRGEDPEALGGNNVCVNQGVQLDLIILALYYYGHIYLQLLTQSQAFW